MENNIIFGPVISRRFGNSLGIDLSPSHKQCNFDCLYCELAPALTLQKQEKSISVDNIITALTQALHEHSGIDVITITANGEPTLYPYLSELIDAIDTIKGKTQTLILTNSATLVDENIYNTLLKFDQVKLSLDAVSSDIFNKIDRPHKNISIENIILHVKKFSNDFKGKLFIEILFVASLNNTKDEINKLNQVLLHVKTTRIDIGTIDRPPAYPVEALSYEELMQISYQFDSSLPIHISSRKKATSQASHYSKNAIINTLDKRPLSEDDIEILFDKDSKQTLKELIKTETIVKTDRSGLFFYVLKENLQRKRNNSKNN
ncbi:MAG: radical SAM protein [Campylobacterota bacterium]|nr:radical SAM protein [Campylobacterota bacterium]